MKKPHFPVLITVTLAFMAFTLGFFLGRNQRHGVVQLSVPTSVQALPPETSAAVKPAAEPANTVAFPIDINTATKEEFMALPGIGEVLAQRILAYRRDHGRFTTVEGLMNVDGIGEKRMEEIWDLITIGG